MAAIVTGATGFIGSHLVDALLEAGEEVTCLVRRASTDLPKAARVLRADFSRADLALDPAVFKKSDTVYHVAGATRATSPAAFHEANVAITERVFDCAVKSGAATRFVYISSLAAAGPTRENATGTLSGGVRALTEKDAPEPIEAYGRSKLAAEEVLSPSRTFTPSVARGPARHEVPVTILRPSAVYGPRDHDFLSIFQMTRRGLAAYPGIRDAIVTPIFVTDLVGGIIAAARSPAAAGRTYFMGSDEPASWSTIYHTAGEIVGRPNFLELDVPIWLVRLGGLGGDVIGHITGHPPLLSTGKAELARPRAWTCSSKRASDDFEFTTPTRLHDGMRATYDWYVNHQWL